MNIVKIKFLVIVAVLIFFDASNSSYCQTNKVQEHQVFTSGSWSYYKTGTFYSINDIKEKFLSGQFKPIEQTVLNAGIPDQYYWIHFVISNREKVEQSLIIDIDNARLNELELFEMSHNRVHSLGKSGDSYSFSQRSIWHKNFVYQVSVESGQDKEYFLFVNQIGHPFTLPLKVLPLKNFGSATFRDYLFDGVTYGILLFVGILTLLFFLTSRHVLYLYYASYIFTAILWFLSYFGLGYQYLWGNYPALNTSMSPIMASINILLNLQICQVLLKLAKRNSILNSMANITKCTLAAVALFPVFINLNQYGYTMNHAYFLLFLITILLAMIIVLSSLCLYVIKGIITAKIYFVASVLKAFSILNLALFELGITPALYNMEGLMQVGIFIEITLLTYALARRYTIFKIKTVEQVIEAQENERSLISQEIHDGISGSLTGINFGIKNFTRDTDHLPAEKRVLLEKIFEELNKVQIEARNISHNTMPDYIKNSSIAHSVEKHVEEVQSKIRNSSVTKDFLRINFSSNEQLVHFSEAVKLNIFRITQELITNILKHSKATTADLLFSFSKRELMIIAEDNGMGIHQLNDERQKGLGIQSIRSRVELLEGSISINSPIHKRTCESGDASPDTKLLPTDYGTMIRIKIPLRGNLLLNKNDHDY